MYSYSSRVEPSDRWAIVAYIRALQVSQSPEAYGMDRFEVEALKKTHAPAAGTESHGGDSHAGESHAGESHIGEAHAEGAAH